MSSLVTQLALSSGRLSRLQLSLDGSRLGCLGVTRTGPLGFSEVRAVVGQGFGVVAESWVLGWQGLRLCNVSKT